MTLKQQSSNPRRSLNSSQRKTLAAAGRRLLSGIVLLALIVALAGVLAPAQTVQAAGPFTVNSTADTHDAFSGDGVCQDSFSQCSLRAAIEQATASGGTTTINLPAGTYTLSSGLGELRMGRTPGTVITLTGTGTPANTIISQSGGANRVIEIDDQLLGNVTVSISNVTIQNGVGGVDGGGGILDGDTGDVLNLTNVVFNNNTTSFSGGAISFSGGGTLNVQNSVFTNNTAPSGYGGAIDLFQAQPGAFTVNNSTFSGNSSSGGALGGQGGALYLFCSACSSMTITNSTFSSNSAVPNGASGGQGGAILLAGGNAAINFNRFFNNTASRGGSGIYDNSATAAAAATNNWWGCSAGPGNPGCDTTGSAGGALTTAPRIVLSLNASPASILINGSSTLTADVLHNSSGASLTTAQASTLIGLPVTWTSGPLGSLSGQQATIQASGSATATFTSNGTPGAAAPSAAIDNQTTPVSIAVNQPPAITSGSNATFTIGLAGSFTLTVTGFPIPAISESGSLPSGVSFVDNGNRTATLSGTPAAGSVGGYPLTITAANGFGSDATQSFTLTVSRANTTTVLTAGPNPSVSGQAVTFTATVTPPGTGTPGGTVEFFEGAASLGSVSLNGSGVASLSLSSLSIGTHTPITAVYAGNTSFNGSTSNTLSQTVTQASTTTLLVGSPNPSVIGQTVTLTAIVTATPPGAGIPTGSVDFFDGAALLGSGTLSGGVVTLASSSLALGTHAALTAVYAGDTNFNGSTSPAFSQTVNQAATATSLTAAPNPSVFGQTVTLTATVTVNSPGVGTPTGTVNFFDGATLLGGATLSGGQASLSTSTLAVGTHAALAAVYAGATNFAGSTSAAFSQTVNPAATTTTLTAGPNPSVFGQSVALTATVTVNPPGAGTPTGTVTFFDGAANLGSATLSSGVASLITSTLAVGTHATLTAVYAGDTAFTGSTSAAASQTVNPASTSTTLVSAPNPSLTGQSVTFTATVTGTPPGAGTPTGSVDFFDGASLLGSGTLNGSGVATLAASSLSVGTHAAITAVYNGSASFNGSTSNTVSQVVNLPATTTVLVGSPNPSVFGQTVTLTATVTVNLPGTGTPTGSVDFFDGASPLGSGTLNGSGVATLAASGLSVGTHAALTAVYAGDTNFNGSTSAAFSQTVNPASTTTTLAGTPHPSVFGQSVTFTATVTVNSPGAGTPGGTVDFFDGASLLGSGTLNGSGAASLATSSLSVASHSITAVYGGDTNYNGSSSILFTQTVNQAASSTALTAAPDLSSVFGQTVTLTATVTATPPGAGTPGGTVTFFDGLTNLGTGTLNVSGVATLSLSSLSVGDHAALTAVYGGSPSFSGSASGAVAHTVSTASTTTVLSAAPNPSLFGQTVTFTATVTVNSPGAGTPSGTVTFFDGATNLGTGTLSAGVATLNTSSLGVGTHAAMTAVYAGDTNFTGSTSSAYSQSVSLPATTTVLTAVPNPSVFGQSVTLTATVTVNPPGTGSPTGSVNFLDGATLLGSGTLSGGVATFSTSSLAMGTHAALTAVYAGDTNFNGSTSNTVSQVVAQGSTGTTLASGTNPSVFGQSVTLTATVTVIPPGAGTPTGTVTFFDGVTSLGTGTLSGITATLSLSSLAVGVHPALTAVYAGDTNFSASTSALVSQSVSAADTNTALTSAISTTLFGYPVTFTAAVTAIAPGGGTPSGSVTFHDGSTVLGVVTLNASGVAVYASSTISRGSHSITADYTPDTPGYNASTLTKTVLVPWRLVFGLIFQ